MFVFSSDAFIAQTFVQVRQLGLQWSKAAVSLTVVKYKMFFSNSKIHVMPHV